jgi:hypothetical protein
MDKFKKIPSLTSLLYITSILLGCSTPIPEQATLATTEILIRTPYQTPTPTIDLPSTLTPIPTASSAQLESMFRRVGSKPCELPCYMDIVPGKTTWVEAQEILEDSGGFFFGSVLEESFVSNGYSLGFDSNLIDSNNNTLESSKSNIIAHFVHVTVIGKLVERIRVSVNTGELNPVFATYWAKYSVRNIFGELGIPDDIVIHISENSQFGIPFDLVLIYTKIGINVGISGFGQGAMICPEITNTNSLSLVLTDLSSGLSPYAPGEIPPTDRSLWQPIDKILGVSTTEFYNRVISNSPACFDVKSANP